MESNIWYLNKPLLHFFEFMDWRDVTPERSRPYCWINGYHVATTSIFRMTVICFVTCGVPFRLTLAFIGGRVYGKNLTIAIGTRAPRVRAHGSKAEFQELELALTYVRHD